MVVLTDDDDGGESTVTYMCSDVMRNLPRSATTPVIHRSAASTTSVHKKEEFYYVQCCAGVWRQSVRVRRRRRRRTWLAKYRPGNNEHAASTCLGEVNKRNTGGCLLSVGLSLCARTVCTSGFSMVMVVAGHT